MAGCVAGCVAGCPAGALAGRPDQKKQRVLLNMHESSVFGAIFLEGITTAAVACLGSGVECGGAGSGPPCVAMQAADKREMA